MTLRELEYEFLDTYAYKIIDKRYFRKFICKKI